MSTRISVFAMSLLLSVLSLAACGSNQQSSPPTSAAASAPASAKGSATLTVEPTSVDGCKPTQPIVATVSWHSSDPHVKVMVANPGQPAPQLFSESGYSGSAKTGKWVVANTRFILIDTASGGTLASRTVSATRCD